MRACVRACVFLPAHEMKENTHTHLHAHAHTHIHGRRHGRGRHTHAHTHTHTHNHTFFRRSTRGSCCHRCPSTATSSSFFRSLSHTLTGTTTHSLGDLHVVPAATAAHQLALQGVLRPHQHEPLGPPHFTHGQRRCSVCHLLAHPLLPGKPPSFHTFYLHIDFYLYVEFVLYIECVSCRVLTGGVPLVPLRVLFFLVGLPARC